MIDKCIEIEVLTVRGFKNLITVHPLDGDGDIEVEIVTVRKRDDRLMTRYSFWGKPEEISKLASTLKKAAEK